MQDVARLLNDMLSAGVITNYAVFGAVAQMRYTPTVATMDAYILVVNEGRDSLDVLSPIYEFCTDRPKDFARILALLESGAVNSEDVAEPALPTPERLDTIQGALSQ